jgi:thienamycin biosynthesis protein ThnO
MHTHVWIVLLRCFEDGDAAFSEEDTMDAATSDPGWESSFAAPMLHCLDGGAAWSGRTTIARNDGQGRPLARLSVAPRVLQQRMLRRAEAAFDALRQPSDAEWAVWMGRVAAACAALARDDATLDRLSAFAGVSRAINRVCFEALARHMAEMPAILAAQSPDLTVAPYRSHAPLRPWAWIPRGRTLAVRVPGSYAMVDIVWMMALAMRRPVLLASSEEDPLTPLLLARACVDAGLPDGALSLVHGPAEGLWAGADQILWYGEGLPPGAGERPVMRYHAGRSKALLLADGTTDLDEAADLMTEAAMRGTGRVCTKLCGVLVEDSDDAAALGRRLAARFAATPVLPLDHPDCKVPAFPLPGDSQREARRVIEAIDRGAIDLTAAVDPRPLEITADGLAWLRPTVLALDADDPLFGAELRFPFITVAVADRAAMTRRVAGSLIVSVFGEDDQLWDRLWGDPAIDKLFKGHEITTLYHASEPHEGHLADFLFRKKAIYPPVEVASRREAWA